MDQRCYDEFLERRIKVWRRTRVLIERLEEAERGVWREELTGRQGAR